MSTSNHRTYRSSIMNNDGDGYPAVALPAANSRGSAPCTRSPRSSRSPPPPCRSRSPRWPGSSGSTLIEPDGRRVRLTPAGRRLAEHAVTILAAVDAARLDLDPDAEPAGTLRVAGFATAIRRSLLPIHAAMARRHPRIRMLIREQEPAEALAMLASDDIDLALVYDYNLAPAGFRGRSRRHPDVVGILEPRGARRRRGCSATAMRARSSTTSAARRGSSTPATPPTRTSCGSSPRWPVSSRRSATARTALNWCRISSSPASGLACCPPINPLRPASDCCPLADPAVQLRSFAVTRRGHNSWPPLALALDLLRPDRGPSELPRTS